VKELPIVIKADVQGSAEVLEEMLPKLSTDQVKLKIINAGVGTVTENDILFASASGAIIIAFGVRPDRKAQDLAQQEKVDIRTHNIIYEVSDEIKKAMEGLLETCLPGNVRGPRGSAQHVPHQGVGHGGRVLCCRRRDQARLADSRSARWRGDLHIEAQLAEALQGRRQRSAHGIECGLGIANFNDVKVGDILECFQVTKLSAAEAAAQGTSAARK